MGFCNAFSKLGNGNEWMVAESVGTCATALNQLGSATFFGGAVHTGKLAEGMDVVSSGCDVISLITEGWKGSWDATKNLSDKPLESLGILIGNAGRCLSAVRFFHKIKVINLKKLDDRLAIARFILGVIGCALAVLSKYKHENGRTVGDQSKHHWDIARYSSLGSLFALCLVSHTVPQLAKPANYLITAASAATCGSFLVHHFKENK